MFIQYLMLITIRKRSGFLEQKIPLDLQQDLYFFILNVRD